MKTYYFFLGAVFCVSMGFVLTSCGKDDPIELPDIVEPPIDGTPSTIPGATASFLDDNQAINGMTECYDMVFPYANEDPYKYWTFNSSFPTLDVQASGWDKDFMTQNWTSSQAQLKTFWVHSYTCIERCNDFLAGLETADNVSENVKLQLKGEAIALRGFEFFGLANTFGRVPILNTGESYLTDPTKPKAENFAEMWDFIIRDFSEAATLLDWEPFQKQYGRCTKGMALTYLGDAYMWKAYTVPETANDCYQKAYDAFQQVINSCVYELSPSFTTLYDAAEAWPKEAIWQIVLNSGDQLGSWDASTNAGARGWTGFFFGPTSNGGWSTYQMSWELYDAFENYLEGDYAGSFDKRRDGSMVTATVPYEMWKDHPTWQQRVVPSQKWIETNKRYLRGYKDGAFDQAEYDKYAITAEGDNGIYDPLHPIGFNPFNQEFVGWCGFHWASANPAPTVWSTKHWRNGRGCDWSTGNLWLPDHIYFKRLANVILDLAECSFRLGYEEEGWALVNQIRERAFGNLEVGKDLSKYITYHQKVADFYGDLGHGDAVDLDGNYPLPFDTTIVKVPDAKEYYTKVKAEKGYTSEVWKIAVNEERRKEFSAEPCLRSDMHKSGFLEDHVNTVYPKNSLPEFGFSVITEWRTARDFDFHVEKMFMPIPANEILMNRRFY